MTNAESTIKIPIVTTIGNQILIKFERLIIPGDVDAWIIAQDDVTKEFLRFKIVFKDDASTQGTLINISGEGEYATINFVNWKSGKSGGTQEPLKVGKFDTTGEEFYIFAWAGIMGEIRKVEIQIMGGKV